MSSYVRRSIKMLTGMHRNFGRRDWTSIGLRGMRLTGRASIRTKVGPTPSSYTHTDESRIVGFVAPATNPSLDSNSSPRRDWRGLLWIALIIFAIAVAAMQAVK
jgi:hypothetical protein